MAKRYLVFLMLFFLASCVSGQKEARMQLSSPPAAPAEERLLTYTVTSDYGKELTRSVKYSVHTVEGPKTIYRFPRAEGPPVRLEFLEKKAKINVSDLNSILERLGLPVFTGSIFQTPDPNKSRHVRYLFDWNTPGGGRLSVEVVLCVCKKTSITECPSGTTHRIGGKYYYGVGRIIYAKRH